MKVICMGLFIAIGVSSPMLASLNSASEFAQFHSLSYTQDESKSSSALPQSSSKTLKVLQLGQKYLSHNADEETGDLVGESLIIDSEAFVTGAVVGEVFAYPNPYRHDEQGTEIGFSLSKDMDTELMVYNMFAHRIFSQQFSAGTPGGYGPPFYNRLRFNSASTKGKKLPSGAYFVYLLSEGSVIGKTKLFIMP